MVNYKTMRDRVLDILGDREMTTKEINNRLPMKRQVSPQLLRSMPGVVTVGSERLEKSSFNCGSDRVKKWRRKRT